VVAGEVRNKKRLAEEVASVFTVLLALWPSALTDLTFLDSFIN
jgi:hypothetical protein